ncbi:MAG: insulinase family protein, partial [Candidatus Kapabacteria bacterium]|nr:insulinase family protein [Candidatus Kapabacteria bacterium]
TRVRLVPAPNEDILSITLGIDMGAVHDEIEGETTFTAAMLTRGTERLTPDAIAEAIESRGCSLSSGATYDVTTLSAVGLGEHADTMLSLMAESLLTPRFDPAEVDRMRERRIADMLMHADDPEWLAIWASMHAAYHGHPYGRLRDGSAETLQQVGPDVMRRVHARMLRYPRAIIVAGPFEPTSMLARLEELLGPLPAADIDPNIAEGTMWTGTAVVAPKDDAVQSVLRIVLPNVPYQHPDRPALSLVTQAVGGYTLARLFMILREQKGYTYGAYAFPDVRRYGRTTLIGTSVGNEYSRDTMRTIYEELRRLTAEMLTADELRNARQYMLGSFARNNETPQQAAGLAWTILQFDLPDDYYTTYVERLQQVTLEECMDVQRRYFDPSMWSMGICGNARVVHDALEGLVERIVHMDPATRSLVDA